MSLWYAICDALPLEMLHWDFMKNAFLALLLMAPLFGILSTMIVTGHMSFFSDALGHSAFTGIAIGSIFGIAAPTWAAVGFSVLFALLFYMFAHLYSGFDVVFQTAAEMMYSNTVAAVISCGIMYVITALLIRAVPNALPMLVLVVGFAFIYPPLSGYDEFANLMDSSAKHLSPAAAALPQEACNACFL